ncbi:Ras-related protein rsr1 [Marasmius crinis-equi]|uniref:Ras-related protein rsr1 n=1 Tax=Marasmius crinis-equi TaxID=585013 RepID=A0ABR3FXE1_9AGAR
MRQFNVVVFGAGGVGKSALTVRFVKNVFVEHYDPTIEEQYRRTVTVDGELSSVRTLSRHPDSACLTRVLEQLEVLDTAGTEQFTTYNEVYIKEASLKEVDNMRKQIYRIKGGNTQSIPIVVVGTKLDLVNEREVPANTISNLSARWNLPFYETSAKRNWHVSEVFEDLLRQLRRTYPTPPTTKKKKHGGCIVM